MVKKLPPLPEILKGRLVVGDWDQIRALNDYERGIENKKQEELDEKNKKRYGVTFSIDGTYYTEIRAKDANEAKEIAQDLFDISQINIDSTDISVEELGS